MGKLKNTGSENFMREAIRLSLVNVRQKGGGPFGAVIVRAGEIIARGWNQVTGTNDPTAHAEVVAIRKACKKLKTFKLEGCEIYTSCEPCPMCLSAIYWAHLDRVYYANTQADAARIDFDDQFIYRELSRPILRRKLPLQPLLRAEALKVFAEWKTKADKIAY